MLDKEGIRFMGAFLQLTSHQQLIHCPINFMHAPIKRSTILHENLFDRVWQLSSHPGYGSQMSLIFVVKKNCWGSKKC